MAQDSLGEILKAEKVPEPLTSEIVKALTLKSCAMLVDKPCDLEAALHSGLGVEPTLQGGGFKGSKASKGGFKGLRVWGSVGLLCPSGGVLRAFFKLVRNLPAKGGRLCRRRCQHGRSPSFQASSGGGPRDSKQGSVAACARVDTLLFRISLEGFHQDSDGV